MKTNLTSLLEKMEKVGFVWKSSLPVRGMCFYELKMLDANNELEHNMILTYKDNIITSYELIEYYPEATYVGSYYTTNYSWYRSEIVLVHCFR